MFSESKTWGVKVFVELKKKINRRLCSNPFMLLFHYLFIDKGTSQILSILVQFKISRYKVMVYARVT